MPGVQRPTCPVNRQDMGVQLTNAVGGARAGCLVLPPLRISLMLPLRDDIGDMQRACALPSVGISNKNTSQDAASLGLWCEALSDVVSARGGVVSPRTLSLYGIFQSIEQ